MGWRDLLDEQSEITLPWTGGGSLHGSARTFQLDKRPREFGWYRFTLTRNTASDPRVADPQPDMLRDEIHGYLVGDRIVDDNTRVDPDPAKIVEQSERVFLIPEELDRFSRIRAGRIYREGPLIFADQAYPLGPEPEVMNAYLDRLPSVQQIKGVQPALDAAFRMEVLQRSVAEARRAELARLRAEEEARLAAERRRQELREKLGDGALRRELALEDFGEAAKAALAVGGAIYLDHRRSARPGEWVVRYVVDGQRLECVCDISMRIVDAGICLEDHRTGVKGDTRFTLESISAVVREAVSLDKLVVWRHV